MKNILECFENTTEKYYNKIGFIDPKRKATFGETMKNAKSIATSLLSYGEKKPIAICINSSCNCIDCMLGVMYSGNYYIVIDVKSPIERIKRILSSLNNPLIIYDEDSYKLSENFKESSDILKYEDIINTHVSEVDLKKVRNDMIDLDIAYIIFTSGSTGVPKGTVINHRSLISYIEWVTKEFEFNNETVFGVQAPLYFSASITDFFSTLKCGCTYNIIPRSCFMFPLKMVDYLNDNRINTIYWVPTALTILSKWKVFDKEIPHYLKYVLFVGEVMPVKHLNYWIDNLDDVTFVNMYGPTEATDLCTFFIVDRRFLETETLPIGKHCDNCNVFILKDDGTEASVGEEGELYIRSSFVANGYYNQPEKTKEAFVQNPLNPYYPETVYKTGDLVKMNERGEILYISRIDFQIKRSGYRIELGEIEVAANSLENVQDCICVFDNDTKTLVLFYEGRVSDRDLVYNQIKNNVPSYMIPDEIIRINELPKNANGKIDRIKLLKIYKEHNGGKDNG